MAKSIHPHLFSSIINILSPETNNMHVVAAYLMCILIFAKIGGHVGGHLGFLRPRHDSSQSPSIFLHLRYVPNHLWNNFLWTSHAHRHPLRDCITLLPCINGMRCANDQPQCEMLNLNETYNCQRLKHVKFL